MTHSLLTSSLQRGDCFPEISRHVETVCPYCGVGCGIILNLSKHGDIVQVDDVPWNESSLGRLCVKGRFGLEFVHSPDRLTTPLIRASTDEEFSPASWDDALDLVARRLVEHRGRLGVLGSAKATNEDSYVVQKFARALLGTNNVDHCARLCHSSSVVAMLEMLGSSATTNSYADFEIAGCLMVAGSDTDVNHPVIAARVRKGVIENGAKLIVINPKRIGLCDIADVWLRPRGGTDVALFNGLAAVVLEEGLWDKEFVVERTEEFDVFRRHLAPYTPSNVTNVTGIPEDDLRLAARLFARPERGNSSLLWGMGMTQHTRGVGNVQAMINFGLLTGQIGKPGSGLSPLRGQNNVQGCSDSGVLPDMLPGYAPVASDARRQPFERAWGVSIPSEPGLKMTHMIEAAHAGDLDALYVSGENPLLTEPALIHARQAIANLSFLVFQGPFLNETAQLAHVVLPTTVFAEKDGTFTNSERRVQLVRRALDGPGQARSDWEITSDIARRTARLLGIDDSGFAYDHPSQIWDEIASLVAPLAGITYGRLEDGGIQWPCPTRDHPGTPLLFSNDFPRGRGRFVPVEQGFPAAELPDDRYPFMLNTGRVLQHWHGGDLTRRVDSLVALYPEVLVSINPADAADCGIVDDAEVRVASRRGEITVIAKLTNDVTPGTVFIPFVRLNGAAANLLTNNVYDPRSMIPEYKACAVRISAVQPEGTDDVNFQ